MLKVTVHQVEQAEVHLVLRNNQSSFVSLLSFSSSFLILWTVLLLTIACDDSVGQSFEGPCGSGDTVIKIGKDRPFKEIKVNQKLTMEHGLQGGYHVDVSLQLSGRFNPDLVDINIDLWLGDWHLGKHRSEDWYLFYGRPDEGACYFYQARVFLFNQKGEIPNETEILGLVGQKPLLKVELHHTNGYDQYEGQFVLDD